MIRQISIASGESTGLNLQFQLPGDLYPASVSSEFLKVEYRPCFAQEIPRAMGLDIEVSVVLRGYEQVRRCRSLNNE